MISLYIRFKATIDFMHSTRFGLIDVEREKKKKKSGCKMLQQYIFTVNLVCLHMIETFFGRVIFGKSFLFCFVTKKKIHFKFHAQFQTNFIYNQQNSNSFTSKLFNIRRNNLIT